MITGGANGIGKCLALTFAAQGNAVAFLDFDRKAGEHTLQEIQKLGVSSLFVWGDIADQAVLEQFSGEVQQQFGRVDYLLHNACLSKKGILSGCGYEEFLYVQRVGVSAPYYLTKLLLPCMKSGASVVNILSTRAFQSQADTESYTAAKGGLAALTHALAVSLSGKVRVNAVAPGWIDTGSYYQDGYQPEYTPADTAQHPSNRVGVPEDIANAVLFLCDEKNSFVNGSVITVDGGISKRMIYSGDEGWEYRVF